MLASILLHSMVLAALMLAWLLRRSSFECSDASILRYSDTWLLLWTVAAILDSIFALLASRTLIARFDRLNALLVLPLIAWVPGDWVASTLAAILASTLTSILASRLGFDSIPPALLTCFNPWSLGPVVLVVQDDRMVAARVDQRGCVDGRLVSWSFNALTLDRADTSPIGHLSDLSLQCSFRSLFLLGSRRLIACLDVSCFYCSSAVVLFLPFVGWELCRVDTCFDADCFDP